jgi:hypothetical protein
VIIWSISMAKTWPISLWTIKGEKFSWKKKKNSSLKTVYCILEILLNHFNRTNSTLPLFIVVPVPTQESEQSCKYVLRLSIMTETVLVNNITTIWANSMLNLKTSKHRQGWQKLMKSGSWLGTGTKIGWS